MMKKHQVSTLAVFHAAESKASAVKGSGNRWREEGFVLRSPVAEVAQGSSVCSWVMEWIPRIPPAAGGHAVKGSVSVSPSSHTSSSYNKPSPVVCGQNRRLQADVGGLQ